MNNNRNKLPKPNVEYATTDSDNLTADNLRALICNPIYAGMGPFPRLVDDEAWVRAAVQMLKKEGAEQFLVNMLFVLRKTFDTTV